MNRTFLFGFLGLLLFGSLFAAINVGEAYTCTASGDYLTADGIIYKNVCASDSNIVKYSCNGPQSRTKPYDIIKDSVSCGTGYVCSDAGGYGKCIADQTSCVSNNPSGSLSVKGTVSYSTYMGKYYGTFAAQTKTDYCSGSYQVNKFSCNGNVPVGPTAYSCPSGSLCSDGMCIENPNKCSDNDGGLNYYAASKIVYSDSSVKDKPLADVCTDANTVIERTCAGTSPSYTAYACPSGYSCSEGACVAKNEFVSCSEVRDSGDDIYSKGTTSYAMWANGQYLSGSYADSCADSTSVNEYYCDANNGAHKYVAFCPSGYSCSEGACMKNPVVRAVCTDVDHGKDIFTKATVTLSTGESKADSCVSDSTVQEYYCVAAAEGDRIESTQLSCGSGYECSEGACVRQQTCVDNDGYNIYNASSAHDSSGWGYDICPSTSAVREYYCSGNTMKYNDVACTSGYVCSNNGGMTGGACVQQTPSCTGPASIDFYHKNSVTYVSSSTSWQSTTKSDYCVDRDTLWKYTCVGNSVSMQADDCPSGYSCSDGACVQSSVTSICNDSDGYNIYMKGIFSGYTSSGYYVSGVESCTSDNQVLEYVCDNNFLKPVNSNGVTCPSGYKCSEGACVLSGTTYTCTETDSGNDKDTFGTLSIFANGVLSQKYEDTCVDSNTVQEYRCVGVGSYNSVNVACGESKECVNGACVKKDTNETPPSLPTETGNLTYTIKLSKGWNMVSSPIYSEVDSSGKRVAPIISTTCADGSTKVYHYKGGEYAKYNPVAVGSLYLSGDWGLWIKSTEACTLTLSGNEKFSLEGLELSKGWNQIGGPHDAVDFSTIKGSCVVTSGPWYYNENSRSGWTKANTLEAGKGYFVKVSEDCKLGEAMPPLPPS